MVGLQSGNSPFKFGKGGGGSKKELPTDNSFRVVPPGIELYLQVAVYHHFSEKEKG